MPTINPVILCGGSGTRLWPLSTPEQPKQFLSLVSQRTMVEDTAARFSSSELSTLEFTEVKVVGSKRHDALLQEKLPNATRILEPFGRDSAPAVAAASLVHNAQDLVLVLPADHVIEDVKAFHAAIEIAALAAMDGAIATFGIHPSFPATGYGYIQTEGDCNSGALSVLEFVEKPDLVTAESYLKSGAYFWNAGIFLFRAEVMIDALNAFAPQVLNSVRESLLEATGKSYHLDPLTFARSPSVSIDYAVMERAENVKTVPVSMGWSDVGGYQAIHQLLTETTSDNISIGPISIQDCEGLYARSEGPSISVNGVSNLVIVATPTDVLITPMNDDQIIKKFSSDAAARRQSFGLDTALVTRTKNWLWNAFSTWSDVGWDPEHGGFVEQMDMRGQPDRSSERRVRVQARQVFSFSKSIELGWPETKTARDLIEKGLKHIDLNLRHSDGGFVHKVAADGSVTDARRDLYDHAFMILAGAAAYRVTSNPRALRIAEDAINFIDRVLKDSKNGGWFESSEFEL
ncbi:MAG: sugar phosphate nucleotidyltransferase, partial [Pseudomonadota bacterium]